MAIAAVPALALIWYVFRPEALLVDRKVNEPLPSRASTLATGVFASDAHATTGRAEIIESEGLRYLRLVDFETSNGPDVRVLLVKGLGTNSKSIKENGWLELGRLKGNIGDQNYEIPEGTDLSQYGTVSIWCKRFSVNFGAAPL